MRRFSTTRLIGRHLVLLTRDPRLMFWNVAFFPIILLIFVGVLSGGDPSVRVVMTTGIVTMSIMANALFSIAGGLTASRQRGVFRRYSLAPIAASGPVIATVIARALLVFGVAILQVLVARVAFGVTWSGGALSWIAVLLVGTAAFAAIGFAIAATARAPHVANTVANLVFIPMMALGGIALPAAMMPDAWAKVYWVLPAASIGEGLTGAFVRGEMVVDNLARLGYLGAWTVVAVAFGASRWRRRGP